LSGLPIGSTKLDRHITTTVETLETADVSEHMKHDDKDHGVNMSQSKMILMDGELQGDDRK